MTISRRRTPAFWSVLTDNQGNLIDPSILQVANDGYAKQAQELRIATPNVGPLRVTAGCSPKAGESFAIRERIAGLADGIRSRICPE